MFIKALLAQVLRCECFNIKALLAFCKKLTAVQGARQLSVIFLGWGVVDDFSHCSISKHSTIFLSG